MCIPQRLPLHKSLGIWQRLKSCIQKRTVDQIAGSEAHQIEHQILIPKEDKKRRRMKKKEKRPGIVTQND